jgi:hypothetical protein
MANEWTCIEKPTKIVRRTVADGTGIPKGTVLKLTDPNTVVASSADNDVFGGISIEEKVANDGVVEIGAAMDGVFDGKDSGAGATVGSIVNIAGANVFSASAAADLLTGSVIGKLEETASASEVVRVRLMG